MMKVDIKYRIQLTGKYNAGVYSCLECDCKLLGSEKHGTLYQHIIGFAGFDISEVAIIECPECFTKWYFHSREGKQSIYKYFLEHISQGTQKHFNK